MEQIIEFVNANVQHAHWIMFAALLLAGLNIPVSEDAMIFISALLSVKYPEYQIKLIAGVFLGAYFSDLICYSVCGRWLGPRLFSIRFFAKFASQKKIDKITEFYEQYGTLTLILGRFIPFGVRNALFISAGLAKMNPIKFALADLLACAISFSLFYWLYYTFGEKVVSYVQQGNIVLFSIAAVVIFLLWKSRKKSKTANVTS